MSLFQSEEIYGVKKCAKESSYLIHRNAQEIKCKSCHFGDDIKILDLGLQIAIKITINRLTDLSSSSFAIAILIRRKFELALNALETLAMCEDCAQVN